MKAKGPRGLGAILCCVVAVGVASPAQAAVDSKVTLTVKDGFKFKGKVISPSLECVVGRKVLIMRKVAGPDQKVRKTFTSENGTYRVDIPMQGGSTLYAKVRRYRAPSGLVCRGDRSRSVSL